VTVAVTADDVSATHDVDVSRDVMTSADAETADGNGTAAALRRPS